MTFVPCFPGPGPALACRYPLCRTPCWAHLWHSACGPAPALPAELDLLPAGIPDDFTLFLPTNDSLKAVLVGGPIPSVVRAYRLPTHFQALLQARNLPLDRSQVRHGARGRAAARSFRPQSCTTALQCWATPAGSSQTSLPTPKGLSP